MMFGRSPQPLEDAFLGVGEEGKEPLHGCDSFHAVFDTLQFHSDTSVVTYETSYEQI